MAPLPPGVWMRRSAPRLPFPLDDGRCRLFSRGRHGLWQGVRALGLRDGDEVLVPAYHHGSEIEAFLQAGLVCRFYGAVESTVPDAHELEALCTARTRALHLVHYLGFPQDAPRWRRWCDERGLLLIEDAAQAWLATLADVPVGSWGDASIVCLYKTFGLPDGAALFCRIPPAVDGRARAGLGGLAIEHALWFASRAAPFGRLVTRYVAPRRITPEQEIALGDATTQPCAATRWVLPRVADAGAATERRRNYQRLAAAFVERTPLEFARMPDGASPFVFPLRSRDKPWLLERLRAQGIRALDLWSTAHPALPADRFPHAATLRRSIIGLPVHQELAAADVDRMIAAVERAEPEA